MSSQLQGPGSTFGHLGRACIAAGAALIAARGADSRAAAVAGGALLSAGALSARWSVFKAGFSSAADPKYTVGPQRERIERGETRGAARTRSKRTEFDRALATPATADRR